MFTGKSAWIRQILVSNFLSAGPRRIIDVIENNLKLKYEGKVKGYFEDVKKNKKYNKNLLKLMCVPFGYCIPRFNNLSIEQMFDMNETDNSDKKKEK